MGDYECPLCDATRIARASLERHVEREHPEHEPDALLEDVAADGGAVSARVGALHVGDRVRVDHDDGTIEGEVIMTVATGAYVETDHGQRYFVGRHGGPLRRCLTYRDETIATRAGVSVLKPQS